MSASVEELGSSRRGGKKKKVVGGGEGGGERGGVAWMDVLGGVLGILVCV